jgi:photosystem II stability/assembly factor-like uncharacterized protein
MMTRWIAVLVACAALAWTHSGIAAAPAAAQDQAASAEPTLPDSWVSTLRWRSIGPANMGGRIIDLCVDESNPTTFWAATASGGLIKTINNGITFQHQFDREATVSIGDAAVAPSDPSIIWVGTGENNPRNSVSWGDGVYKSTDGGRTWTNMGLRESFQIGRIIIHPANPDIVYVGALGRLWGPSEERGLFKTTDGGKNWERILFIDDKTGIIDIAMHPGDPDTLLVAAWERQRDEYCTNDPAKRWGAGSGLYKTTDAGATFRRITEGLPTCELGRIGLDYWRKNPDVIYATVDSVRIGSTNENAAYMGITGADAEAGARLTQIVEGGPAAEAGLKVGDIVLSVDGKSVLSYESLLAELRTRSAGDTVKLTVARERQPLELEVALAKRPDQNQFPFRDRLGGQVANIHEQQGPEGDEFGGLYRSDDGGETWKRINSLNPRPMYFSKVRIDPQDDQRIYVLGVPLYVSDDGGKTFRSDGAPGVHADHHAMWINPDDTSHMILGCDGGIYITYDRGRNWDHLNNTAIGQFYHVTVDNRKGVYYAYGGLQDNGSWGGPTRSRSGALVNYDWFRVGGGDGFVCLVCPDDPDLIYYESQNGATGWRNLRTGRGGSLRPPAEEGLRFRWNWKTPFILSANNSRIYFNAGSHVFRTLAAGTAMKRISPEITRTGRGSATALAQSPLDTDVLYVGTDDGAMWMTRDGGHTWIDLFNLSAEEERPAASPAAPAASAPATAGDERTGAPGEPPRGGLISSLRQMDANSDGKIHRDEVPERMRRLFDQFDANSDGILDEEELVAAAARGPGRGPGRGPADPAGPHVGVPPLPAAAQPPSEPAPVDPQQVEVGVEEPSEPAPAPGPAATPSTPPTPGSGEDLVSGQWDMRILAELPAATGQFTLMLILGEDGAISGEVRSQAARGTVSGGSFNPATGELRITIETPLGQAQVEAKIENGKLTGTLTAQDGLLNVGLEGTRASATEGPERPAARAPAPQQPPRGGRRAARPAPDLPAGKPLIDLVPKAMHVAALEASRFVPGRIYIAFDGHRSDDDAPYIFISEDFGRTWMSITSNLPQFGSVRTIREDITRPDVLYVGTEFACFVSINRGQDWTRLNNNLPTVAVHEFAQHPSNGEIVAGTHGRSLWVLDATTLRQITPEIVQASSHLFRPNTAHIWRGEPARGISGARHFRAEGPPTSAHIFYSLGKTAAEIELSIVEVDGTPVRSLAVTAKEPGLHRIAWDLRQDPPTDREGRPVNRPGARVAPGLYRIVLVVDGQRHTQPLRIEWDPDFAEHQAAEFEEATDDHHRQHLLEERRLLDEMLEQRVH